MLLPITLTMAGAAAFIHIWLAFRCSRIRMHEKIAMGDGGNPDLLRRMRAHSNFAENTPLFLILLGLNELGSGSAQWLWVAGILFIVARISHAIGMDRSPTSPFRAIGMLVTLLVLAALAIAAIMLSYEAGQPVMIG